MSLFEAYWSYSYADVIEQSEHKVSSLRRFASWIAFPRSKSKLAPAARALLVAGSLAAVIFVASAAPHLESEKRASPLAHSAHSPSPVLSLAKADDFPLDADFSVETASQTWERRLFAKAEPYDPDSMRFGSQKMQRSIVERVVKAAAVTGSDPALLLSIADKELSFILKAKASTSSASGLFQFIDSTWMTAMKSFGWRHLQQEAQGSPAEGVKPVASISRSEILKLRNDPYLSAVLAAEILKTEGAKISGEIGRGLTAGETYLIHFLGPDDARRFMAKMDQDPQTPAAKLLPRPARANRSIFFASLNGRLKPKSLREVHDAFEAMMMARVDRFRDAEARVPDAVARGERGRRHGLYREQVGKRRRSASQSEAGLAPQAGPSISSRFWTAAPEAPLPRLSSRATRTAWRFASLAKTKSSISSEPLSVVASSRAPSGATGSPNMPRAGVMPGERLAQRRRLGTPRQRVEPERDRDEHPLPEIADGGHEERLAREARMGRDLRQVLML